MKASGCRVHESVARVVQNPDGEFPQADTQSARGRFLPAGFAAENDLKLRIPGSFQVYLTDCGFPVTPRAKTSKSL
jgi:hypothetical protein